MADKAKLEAEYRALDDAKKKFESDAKAVTEAYNKKKAELTLVQQKVQTARQKLIAEKEEFDKAKVAFAEEKKQLLDLKQKLEQEQQEIAKYKEERRKFAEEVKKYEQMKNQLVEERKALENAKRLQKKDEPPSPRSSHGASSPTIIAPKPTPKQAPATDKRSNRRSSLFLGDPNASRQRPSSMHIASTQSQWRKSMNSHLRGNPRETGLDMQELRKQVAAYDQQQSKTTGAKIPAKPVPPVPDTKKKDSKALLGSSKKPVKPEPPKFQFPTAIPNSFKLPPARPVYELKKENLPLVPLKIFEFDIISNLNLSQNYLNALPDEIGKLKNLVELDVSHNHIKKLPNLLTKCTQLQTLLIGGNPDILIPSNIITMENLTTVSLQRNRLELLPEEICKIPHLEHLDISFNNVKQLTPAIGGLNSLLTLVAGPNNLTDIPREIGELSSLTFLDFKQNQITKLPKEIGNLINLEEFYISDNKITGFPFQMNLVTMPTLFKLDAFKNEIVELHPNFFQGASECSLEELLLGRNRLSTLPEGLFDIPHMVVLDLRYNDITQLPTQIGNFFELTVLDIGYNKLTSIPEEISQCGNLITLNLFGNSLKGLPDAFKHSNRLRQLYLGYNQLTDLEALEDGRFEDLEELCFSGNFELATIPPGLCTSTPLVRYLYLNNLNLTSLPSAIGSLANLEQLDLSHNNLTTVPVEIFQLRQLYSLDISHNKLVTSKPGTGEDNWDEVNWAHECGVEILDLSFNSLSSLPPGAKDLMARGASVFYYGNPFAQKDNGQLLSCPYPSGWSELVGRRPSQEDALSCTGKINDTMSFFGLFDGHAGRGAADFAAHNFAQHLKDKIASEKGGGDLQRILMDTFYTVNEAFRKHSANSKDSSIKHCGTTGIAVLITPTEIFTANVGDARAVLYKGGDNSNNFSSNHDLCSNNNCIRLSNDHKPDDEEGRIREGGGYVVDSRVNGFLGVSRSIGDFYLDAVICEPFGSKHALPTHQDAFIVLGCDGVWDEFSDAEVCTIAQKYTASAGNDPHKIAAVVRDFSFYLGSDDNVSVMIVKLKK